MESDTGRVGWVGAIIWYMNAFELYSYYKKNTERNEQKNRGGGAGDEKGGWGFECRSSLFVCLLNGLKDIRIKNVTYK